MSNVEVQSYPTRVTVSIKGTQGPPGAPGVVTPELQELADEAAQSAQSSSSFANSASQSADAAESNAGMAAGHAEDAEAASQQAQQSAQSALQSAQLAEMMANETGVDADNSAQSAAQSAASAAASAASAISGERYGVATRSDLNALAGVELNEVRAVTNDPVLANNGAWRKTGAGASDWTQAADRTSALSVQVASVKDTYYPVTPTFSSAYSLDVYRLEQGRVEFYVDASGVTRVGLTSTRDGVARYPQQTADLSSVGTGTPVLSPAGAIRSVRGEGNIGIEVTDDTLVVTDGGQVEPPHEFVICLVIGQSNNTEEGGNAAEATPLPTGVAFEYRDTSPVLLDLATSPTAQRASVMPGMALEFWRRTGLGVIFVNSAFGSSAMAAAASPAGLPTRNWDVSGSLRSLAVTRLNAGRAMATAQGLNWQNGWISWSQGEQDGLQINNGVITVSDYEAAFEGLIAYLHENVGEKVPFLITRTSYRTADSAGYQQIRAAQMKFASEINGVFMAFTGTMSFFPRGLMADGVHYNQAGKNIAGKRVAAIAAVTAAGVN